MELAFKTHDGLDMYGKLVLPVGAPAAVVIYVQTAEGATVDLKRRKSRDETFNYFDLYRERLTAMDVGFFSYEGRGIRMASDPPRFEQIDRAVFDTGTLDNKVRDVLSAIAALRQQAGLRGVRVVLMGASEGTLIAAEAASRAPEEVAGLVLYGVLASNMRDNFRYIMTDGALLPFRAGLDADNDGKISRTEYDADARGYRAKGALKGVPFPTLDADGDGQFTSADIVILGTKVYVDAIEAENFEVLQDWARTSAAVAVPAGWFKDHFAHEPIWTFLSGLDIPVGCFQGMADAMVSPAAVKAIEARASAARKSKMVFQYFDGLDHSLNIQEYFLRGEMPAGHRAIFEFIQRVASPK